MPETNEHPHVDVPERPDLAAKIQDSFDKVFGDVNENDLLDEEQAVDETPEAQEDTAKDAEEPAKDAEESDDEQPTEEATEEQETPKVDEAAAQPAKRASGAPTLPDAYRRSLKAYEWTDAEIDDAAKVPGFLETAAKLHNTRNREVAAWADMGRKQRQTEAPAKDAATAVQHDDAPTQLKPVDAAKLKKQYGEEALIDEIVGPINQVVEQINRILPAVQQTQQRSQQAQLETFARQIDGFFSGKDMAPHKDQYGVNSASLTNEQLTARQKVLELADAVIVGARQQHRVLSFDEAMQIAHDSVSSGTQKQAARKEIAATLKQRNKGITLKPSARGGRVANPTGSRNDLEKSVKSRLASVFG